MNKIVAGKNEYSRTFELTELVSAYYFSLSRADAPYWERHGFSQIYVLLEGEGRYVVGEKSYELSRGMMFYCPADTDFMHIWTSEKISFALISFVCNSEAMKVFENGPIRLCDEELSLLIDIIRTTERICDHSKIKKPPRYEIFIKPDTPSVVICYIYASLERLLSTIYCRLMGIDLLLNENQKANNYIDSSRLVADIKVYLSEHVNEKVMLEEICRHFGVGQTALMQKFRLETNQTVIEYFNELKIARAKVLLQNTSKSFTDIADELGFSSINYFSKLFKAKTGMTLTEFSRLSSKRGLRV